VESLSVNLDALLVREERAIGEMSIKHYRFPDVPQGTYRLFFSDGRYQDVEAENASHAFQLAENGRVERIANLKFVYTHILERNVIHPSGKEVKPSLATDNHLTSPLSADISDMPKGSFEMLDFTEFSALTKAALSQD
jgi:hypothetical protein